ncbi:hypothetical protein RQP46_005635 [Phenoliferia psychrophenolica]
MEAIISHLKYDDLYSLASTSKLFRKTYRLRAILMHLEDFAICDADNWNGELFCLSDAEPGSFGWSPFLLMLSGETLEVDDAGQYLHVQVMSPAFERFDEDEPTDAYLFIQQTDAEVWFKEGYFDGQFEKDLSDSEWLDWDSDLAGRLIRATPKLLQSRFKCPECKGSRLVKLGSGGVMRRYASGPAFRFICKQY